jgi:hypothetical protein
MAAKLTRLTHKIAIQLQRVVPFTVAPGGQSGNFWVHPRNNFIIRDVDVNEYGLLLILGP